MKLSEEIHQVGDIEIAQDLKAQCRLWLIQRWGRGAVSSKLGLVGGSSLELQQFNWPRSLHGSDS